jgi:antitoxin ParD1/3/4
MCNQALLLADKACVAAIAVPEVADGERRLVGSAFWLAPIWFVMIDPEGKVPPVPQGKPHSVDLTPDLENAIQRRLDSGAYKSDVEVIRAGLRALDRDDEEKARRLARLDASIARGIADADAGRVHPADQVFSELRQRIQQKADTRGR